MSASLAVICYASDDAIINSGCSTQPLYIVHCLLIPLDDFGYSVYLGGHQ